MEKKGARSETQVTNIIEPWQLEAFYHGAIEHKGLPDRYVAYEISNKFFIRFSAWFESKEDSDRYFEWSSEERRKTLKQSF